MELLLATRNAHKTREFAQILGNDFQISDLSDSNVPLVQETGDTFEKNAVQKAVIMSRDRPAFASLRHGKHLLVIADDSGLEVDTLEGAPGIYSARYAGKDANDQQNIDKLLRELAARDPTNAKRSARFRCLIAVARGGQSLGTFEGIVEGTIVDLPRGKRGFGYDPIFVPQGYNQTFGELSSEIKNRISHRAQATRKLREYLSTARPSSGT